ncbi:uncharacterized protein PV09_02558 [Verruconis gallopava]|uniref:Uncharacterized protein n=1 Tax=Verruconis gallopava TaxID=253628 RepID=A0A0D1Z1T0_9PEZI|nr:uncharacterized protein PV09_02558 [Verruconis gallopava]KIW06882.1 hypothetical protein PV09_02558 [Verruconis gallopava]
MDPSYYTVLGWTVTIVGGGIAYYYYSRPDGRHRDFRGRAQRNNLPRPATTATQDSQDEASNIKRRKRDERARAAPSSGSRNSRDSETDSAQLANSTSKRVALDDGEEEKEDVSWAHQLNQKKKGTTLAPPARAATRQKTVKQSNANNRAAELSTEESSAAGDAEYDLSPAISLTANDKTPSGRDVSDMLEPAAPGPSILKISEPTNTFKGNKSKQQKQAKAAPQQETKKQRQNRKKAEERKAQREADEKERKILEEQQRRRARIERGEPAKNGLGSQKPASNAWKAGSGPATSGQLLDTFNNDDTTTATESTAPTSVSSSPTQVTATATAADKEDWWAKNTIPEEEQTRMLREQDEDSWVTVGQKGKKVHRHPQGGAVQTVAVV